MFGYIRPVKEELYVKDSKFYSSVYCGLCRYGGKHISHITRWMLNYDFVLLALLKMSFSKEALCMEKKRCPYTLRKKNCACADRSYSFVCSAFGLLTYEKLLDDIKDEKGLKRFSKLLLKPFLKHIAKKCDNFEELKTIIKNGITELNNAENKKCTSPDKAANGFASIIKNIVAYGFEDNTKLIAENCGYHIGRFIYLTDALDDIADDNKSGNYNPFILHYGSVENVYNSIEQIVETIYDSLNAFSNYYALFVNEPLNGIDRLIYNITELGGRAAVQRIIERNNKNDKPL